MDARPHHTHQPTSFLLLLHAELKSAFLRHDHSFHYYSQSPCMVIKCLLGCLHWDIISRTDCLKLTEALSTVTVLSLVANIDPWLERFVYDFYYY